MITVGRRAAPAGRAILRYFYGLCTGSLSSLRTLPTLFCCGFRDPMRHIGNGVRKPCRAHPQDRVEVPSRSRRSHLSGAGAFSMADNLLFFTELLSMPVFDLKGRRIGRVKDAALVPLVHASRIDRLLVGGGDAWLDHPLRSGPLHLPGPRASTLSDEQSSSRITTTSTCCASPATCWTSRSSMSPAARWCASTTSPWRSSTMACATRSTCSKSISGSAAFSAASCRACCRPRWIRRLQRRIPPNSIRWEFANVVEPDPLRRLRLNISYGKLEEMHPADLADIVEELGPAEREAIFETIDSEVAADALSEVEPQDAGQHPGIAGAGEGRRHRRGDGARRGGRRPRRTGGGDLRRDSRRDGLRAQDRSPRTARIRRGHRRRHDEHRVRRAARRRHGGRRAERPSRATKTCWKRSTPCSWWTPRSG